MLNEYIVAYKWEEHRVRSFLCKLCGFDENGEPKKEKRVSELRRMVRHLREDHNITLTR